MTSAEGYYDSMYGRIESSRKTDIGRLKYSAKVPENTTATLFPPAIYTKSIRENDKPLKKVKGVSLIKYENGKVVLELKSGNYNFSSEM
jgi:alpha-L-rhamnosidase